MSEHASDCGLHNAPALAPGNCSCGVSRLFRIYRYDVTNDTFRWVTFSREALVADTVSGALARVYGEQRTIRNSTLIERAIRCGLTPNERAAVLDAWSELRVRGMSANIRKLGHLSGWSDLDGRYLQLEDMPGLLTMPTDEEIAEVLALWFEYWRSLPEPVVTTNAWGKKLNESFAAA